MPAPIFAASYSSAYNTSTSTKDLTITTQAGDTLVVYGGGENEGVTLSTPAGNSISFTLQQSIVVSGYASAYMWTGVDSTGATSWTLSCTGGGGRWGFSCLIFRNTVGIGASNKTNAAGTAPSLNLTTTSNNSAVVVFNGDWDAQNGSSRTWLTVNGITPSSGNNEIDYSYTSGVWTAYGAYYPSVGTAGSVTVGLSAPTNQTYSIVAVEVKGWPSYKISTLTEAFSSGSMDGSKWVLMTNGGSSSQSTGQLVVSPTSNSPGYEGYISLDTYNLTNSEIYIANIQGLSTDVGCETVLSLQTDGTNANSLSFLSAQTGYITRVRTSSSNDDTYFSPRDESGANHWWRIREKYGNIYWDTSPDCTTWTNRRMTSLPAFPITDLTVVVCAGTWQNVATPGQAIFDNLNTYGISSLPIGWTGGIST